MIYKLEKLLFYSLILFLPSQLGKHFWPEFAFVNGIRVDYLAPTIYFTDILVASLFGAWFVRFQSRHSGRVQNLSKAQRFKAKVMYLREILDPARMTVGGFLLVLLLLVLNLILSKNTPGGFYSLLKFFEFSFLASYVATTVKTPAQVQRIGILLAVGVLFESSLAFAQYVLQGSVGGLLYFLGERTFTAATPGIANAALDGKLVMRPYGTFPHPNVLAGYLVVGLVLLVGLITKIPRPAGHPLSLKGANTRLPLYLKGDGGIYSTAIIFGSFALFLTMSRVAILFAVFCFVVVVVKKFFRHPGPPTPVKQAASLRPAQDLFKAQRSNVSDSALLGASSRRATPPVGGSLARMKIFVFLLFSLFAFLFFASPLVPRFSQTSLAEESFVQREKLMDAATVMINSHPLTGVGLGNFLPTLATIQSLLSLGLYLQPVHNIFLLVAAELGITGFIIFVWFMMRTLFHALAHRENRTFAVMLFAVIILGFFDHYFLTLQQGQLLFAFVVGLCWTKVR